MCIVRHFIEHSQNQEMFLPQLKKKKPEITTSPLICSLLPRSLVYLIPVAPQLFDILKEIFFHFIRQRFFWKGHTCLLCPIISFLGMKVLSTSFNSHLIYLPISSKFQLNLDFISSLNPIF